MIGRLRERDKRVIEHLGKSRQLTQRQIGLLEFPYKGKKNKLYSYQTCQRRIREFYLPNGLLDHPVYLDLSNTRDTGLTPIYRLGKEGKALYKHLTGENVKMNEISFRYTPHLIETNKIVVHLKRKGYLQQNFEIESKIGSKRADLKLEFENFNVYVEVDLSESEYKREIQKQFKAYKQEGSVNVLYYSNRCRTLQKWIQEIYEGRVNIKVCKRKTKSVINSIRKFAT